MKNILFLGLIVFANAFTMQRPIDLSRVGPASASAGAMDDEQRKNNSFEVEILLCNNDITTKDEVAIIDLCKAGIDPHYTTMHGESLLKMAAKTQNVLIIGALLRTGCDVHESDNLTQEEVAILGSILADMNSDVEHMFEKSIIIAQFDVALEELKETMALQRSKEGDKCLLM